MLICSFKTRPVTGVTQIGEELSIMIYLRDGRSHSHPQLRDGRSGADVRARDCWAYDSDHFSAAGTQRLQLTSEQGCTL